MDKITYGSSVVKVTRGDSPAVSELDLMLSRPSGNGDTYSFKMNKKWRPLLFPESETYIINAD